MMSVFITLLKNNTKLIFRNKQAILLILLIPILSTLILNMTQVSENKDPARKYKMGVLIVDASKTALSEELIASLQKNPAMAVEVLEKSLQDEKQIREYFIKEANKLEKNSFVYIPKDFQTKILKGEMENTVLMFDTGADERAELLNLNLNMMLSKYAMFSKAAKGNQDAFNQIIKTAKQNETKGERILLNKEGEEITSHKDAYSFSLSMFVAALTIILIFSNNFIVGLFIKEKHNGVLKRIQLTNTSMLSYVMVKMVLAVAVLILQTALIMLGITLIVKMDLGISVWGIGLLIFGLGLVLTCISVCSGIIFDNMTTSNYAGLAFVVVANMLAGLYFPLEGAPSWMQNAAMLFPQRWFIYTVKSMMQGNNQILYQYGMVTGAMILFFLALSLFGFKINKSYN